MNYEHSIREYAAAGYNLILVVGAEFSNACLAVGKDYPDVMPAQSLSEADRLPRRVKATF